MNERSVVDELSVNQLIEILREAVVLVNESGEIIKVNSATGKLFKYDCEELVGKNISILIPKENKKVHSSSIKQFFENPVDRKMGITNEQIGLCKDGTIVPVEIRLSPFEIENNTVVIATIKDISERKKIEKELVQYKYFFNHTHDLTCIANTEGYFEVINEQFTRLLGYSEEELLKNKFLDYIHPEDLQATLNEISKLEKGKVTLSFINRYRTKKGDYLWFEWTSAPDPDSGKLYATARDVSQRMRSEAQFRLLVDSIPNAIVLVNSSGYITTINKRTETLFGYSKDELKGQKLEILIPRRYKNCHVASRSDYLSDPKTRGMGAGRDLYALRKDGTEFPAEIGLNPIKSDEEMLVLASIIDITERKKLENELNDVSEILKKQNDELIMSDKKLREAVSTKDKFFSILAHDLKNPFSIIMGYSEILSSTMKTLKQETIYEYIKEIYASTKTTYSLLENLLAWALSQQDRILIHKTQLKLKKIILESSAPYSPNSRKKKITFDISISDNQIIFADKYTFTTILGNLISNAIKFTPVNGRIEISHERKNGFDELKITDTGVGMTDEQINNLFKVEKSKSTMGTMNEEGTGLGLILCKEFIEKNDGRINIESKREEGSTFTIFLPVK